MIELYTAQSSNGQRAAIALEECGLPYRVHKFDLMKGEQRTPEFLKLNPAGAIPVIVDPEGPGARRSRWRSPGPSRSMPPRRRASSCRETRRGERSRCSGSCSPPPTAHRRRCWSSSNRCCSRKSCRPISRSARNVCVKYLPGGRWPARGPRMARRRGLHRRFRAVSDLRRPQRLHRQGRRPAESHAVDGGDFGAACGCESECARPS